MCGIGAFQLKEGDGDPRRLAQNLLRGLIVRGRDASGVAWHSDSDGETYIQKHNCDGVQLAKSLDKEVGRTAIVHTRYATLGSPHKYENNHPIDVNGVVGVHNGHINNHDELFKKVRGYDRKGAVDSEAIFAYLRYGPAGRSLTDKLSDLRGAAAVFWLQTNSPKKYLHVARLTSSPLCYGRTPRGSVIFASTPAILTTAVKHSDMRIGKITELDEGVYLRFENGELTRTLDVPDCRPQPTLFSTTGFTPHPRPSTAVGTAVGGQYRDGKWLTRLDLLMEEWEQSEFEARRDK